jgi:hypothetical protein
LLEDQTRCQSPAGRKTQSGQPTRTKSPCGEEFMSITSRSRIGEGQRLQQHRVGHRKNGRAGADSNASTTIAVALMPGL